ncbi:MAG: hypothetical protein HGA78_03815 [Nitrospirales bacterium]|nr:hypothetical protein [Nitrospirales bacterium]
MSAKETVDLYFLENRARLLDIASFLDRVDRGGDSEEAKTDFRYKAFIRALRLLLETEGKRTAVIQLSFSDLSSEPVESAAGLKAVGAWEGAFHEDN